MTATYTLYGPWTLSFSGRGTRMRVTIAGSDSADGLHVLPFQPFALAVNGSEWTVTGERLDADTETWRPHNVQAATSWDLTAGMRVTLDWFYRITTEPEPGFHALVARHRILLDCISNDPVLQPVLTVPPPDFTIPGPG